jgi:hypothetical protein
MIDYTLLYVSYSENIMTQFIIVINLLFNKSIKDLVNRCLCECRHLLRTICHCINMRDEDNIILNSWKYRELMEYVELKIKQTVLLRLKINREIEKGSHKLLTYLQDNSLPSLESVEDKWKNFDTFFEENWTFISNDLNRLYKTASPEIILNYVIS